MFSSLLFFLCCFYRQCFLVRGELSYHS
jgi:hypothetical protein